MLAFLGTDHRSDQPMKVLDEAGKSVAAGSTLRLDDLGLPVAGDHGVLIVFWKRQ